MVGMKLELIICKVVMIYFLPNQSIANIIELVLAMFGEFSSTL